MQAGQWSEWIKLDFELTTPAFVPNKNVSGICRFYLQEVTPNFRLYVTPSNIDPSDPAVQMAEPDTFRSRCLPRSGTVLHHGVPGGSQSAVERRVHRRRVRQAGDMVLEERLELLEYAVEDYDDGLLFFYFSSSDLQSHMFWWDSDAQHPTRSAAEAQKYFGHIDDSTSGSTPWSATFCDRYGDQGDHHRDERSRLRQLRPAIQSQFLVAGTWLSRPARLHVAVARRATGRGRRRTEWGSTGSI